MEKHDAIKVPAVLTPETARELFFACDCNYRKIPEVLGDRYGEYEKIVDNGKLQRKWASEECAQILRNIIDDCSENYGLDFVRMGSLAEMWISDGEMLHPELLTEAWKKVIARCGTDARIGAVKRYLNRFRIAETETKIKLLPLLDLFRDHLQSLTREQLYIIGMLGTGDEFRNVCANLRRQIHENTAPENSSLRFVRTPAAYLDIIVDSLMRKWNSMDTVKGSTGEMNCAWGVENEWLYVSGVSSSTNSADPRSFAIMEFVAVLPVEKQAYLFRCKLDDSGRYAVTECDPAVKPLVPQLDEAVALYRNRIAWDAFVREQGLAHWYNELEDRRQEYLARFPKVFRDIYARIPECSIKETLLCMVDTAEELYPEYGGSADDFCAPAAEAEISEWERTHGITIPEEYKEFLRFANGVRLPNGAEFSGLRNLGSCLEYLADEEWENYCDAGSFIGDGTMLCFDDEGNFYEWQDGEMTCLGDFDGAVSYICEI